MSLSQWLPYLRPSDLIQLVLARYTLFIVPLYYHFYIVHSFLKIFFLTLETMSHYVLNNTALRKKQLIVIYKPTWLNFKFTIVRSCNLFFERIFRLCCHVFLLIYICQMIAQSNNLFDLCYKLQILIVAV